MKKCFALLTLVFSIFLPSSLIAQSGAIDELDSVSVPGTVTVTDAITGDVLTSDAAVRSQNILFLRG